MLKILLFKLFFFVCTLLVSVNIFELIPHQIVSLDFFTQLSLWSICVGFFVQLKFPKRKSFSNTDVKQLMIQIQNPSK